MIDIAEIISSENKIEEFLEYYADNIDLPVILYGAGAGAYWYIAFAHQRDIPIHCVVDKSVSSKRKMFIEKTVVYNISDIFKKYEEAIVIISAPKYRKEIEKNIRQCKPLYHIYSFDPTLEVLQGVSSKDRRRFFKNNISKIENLWNKLADDFSKETLEYVIKGSVTGDCDCYSDIASDSQYFPDIIKKEMFNNFKRGGVFIDIGAYTGDTIYEFLEVVKDNFTRYYAFEPDKSNYDVLCDNFRENDRIVKIRKGVGSQNTYVYFRNEKNSYGSHIVDNLSDANAEIEVVRLDDILEEEIGFIKMDIEGMELEALRGATETIRAYKPILAISVYHKMEDIIEIPQYIMNLNLGYKLYLRHYWDCNGTDTILFAL